MAHQMVKPYSFLLYILSLIAFFFVGVTYAGIMEVAKNQGLAGGAIVLGYGVITGAIGLIIALVISNKTNRKIIFTINIILALCITGFYIHFHLKYLEKQKDKEEKLKIEQPKPAAVTASYVNNLTEPTALPYIGETHFQKITSSGLGMFSPNIFENKTFYFYGNLNFEKTLMDHNPTDSITFISNKHNNFDIATAPPWLVPDHLKLDYNLFYFRVIAVTEEFIEVVVNSVTQQTAYVDKRAGKLMYWPEFLLSIHSVEFLDAKSHNVYVKPLDHAGTVNQLYSFMRPLKIKQDWMHVALLNESLEVKGKGWIKWNNSGKLLIKYSLLS